jgi:uncharacterized OB-fold protein
MKKCPKCGRAPIGLYGDNYCTKCGTKLEVVEMDEYICGNPACKEHIMGHVFMPIHKYCGECGSELLLVRSDTNEQ